MWVEGMGTEVQYKSYFQGYSSMRDLNDDTGSGNWPLCYEDQLLKSRQYYNGCLPRPATDGHSDYGKEMLKKTMLEHEAIFRNQVFELHRLYRKQRDLMEELRRNEVCQYPVAVETSQLKYISYKMPFEHAQNPSHISGAPFMNSSCSRPSISGTDDRKSLNFVKESSMQVDSVPTQNGNFEECKFVESNSAKLPRRMFDLQLPGDEYIDSEGEGIEEDKVSQASGVASYPPERKSGVATDTNVNLSLSNGGNPKYRGDASSSESYLWNKHGLADLNQPIQVEEAASSVPISNILCPISCNGGIQRHHLPMKQNPGSFHRDFFHKVHTDNRTDINSPCSENVGSRTEWQPYNLEAGQSRKKFNSFSQGFGPEEFHAASRSFQSEFKGTQLPAFLVGDKNKREPWKESAISSTEISKRTTSLSNHSFSRSIDLPHMNSPYPTIPDMADSGSSFYSSWRKPMSSLSQDQVAVQALPFFNNPSHSNTNYRMPIQNSGIIDAQWHLNNHTRSNSVFGNQVPYQNGYCNGPQLGSSASQVHLPSVGFDFRDCRNDYTSTSEHFENRSTTKFFKGSNCMDVKSAKDINLNLAIPNGLAEERDAERDRVIIDGEGKNDDAVRGLPWLKKTPVNCNGPSKGREASNETGIDLVKPCSLSSNRREASNEVGFDLMKPYYLNSNQKETVPSSSFVWDTASASYARVTEEQMIQKSDSSSSKKILGFPIFDKPHMSKDESSHSFSSQSHQKLSEVEATHNNEKVGPFNIDLHDPALLDTDKKLSTENLVVRDICGVKNHFNLNSSVDEEEPLTGFRLGSKVNIDLEAPVVPDSIEDIPPEVESQGKKLEPLAQSPQVEVGDPSEDLDRLVAEAIVSISLTGVHQSDDVTCHPPETPLCDSLQWFAEIVSSNTNDLQSRETGIRDFHESDSDASDYFEMMTLKLTETKVDEYWPRPWAPETQNEEETVAPSFPTRRRRGQSRRGRQRRDFQRDILPGLTSLSRHEVTADLQIIGGLMKATGHTWQSGLAKRNGARNGWARGRRRGRNTTSAVVATVVCSPPRQQTETVDPGLEDISLKGWGKTTRRPRRQRVAAGN